MEIYRPEEQNVDVVIKLKVLQINRLVWRGMN